MTTDRELELMEGELKLRERIDDLLEQRQLLMNEITSHEETIAFHSSDSKLFKDKFWIHVYLGTFVGALMGAIAFGVVDWLIGDNPHLWSLLPHTAFTFSVAFWTRVVVKDVQ